MATLIADRFLYHDTAAAAQDFDVVAIDLASGDRARVQLARAGARREQQEWADGCAQKYAAGSLLDFGFIGATHRFEAFALRPCRGRGRAPAEDGMLDWLEYKHPSSAQVLYVARVPDARDIRLRGFVPCDAAVIGDDTVSRDIPSVLAKRSVALLDCRGPEGTLALAVLRLRQFDVRDICVLVQRSRPGRAGIAAAAESRPVYAPRPLRTDPHVSQLMSEAAKALERGRHAAVERALRGAAGAAGRRGDWMKAGDAQMALGRLLLQRGRPADALAIYRDAHACFQRGRAACEAVDATVHLGIAQTDLAELIDAEQTCRAAYAAATALRHPGGVLSAATALARTLYWQDRRADAMSLLSAVTPCGDGISTTRYWCLVARLQLEGGGLSEARDAIAHARRACAASSGMESRIRLCEARVQARLGDLDALGLHIAAGLTAARAAHLPLEAIKLRLTQADGLVRAGHASAARRMMGHLSALARRRTVPPLLKSHIATSLKMLEQPSPNEGARAAREAIVVDEERGEIDRVRSLLSLSHQFEDEAEALARVATAMRRHIHAAGVGVFGSRSSVTRMVASSGICSEQPAQRAIGIGQPIPPGQAGAWIEGAVPIQYLGRVIGAVAFRWNIEGPQNIERALAFGAAAAAVCAPLVYVLLERHHPPAAAEMPFEIAGVSAAIGDVRQAIARAANAPFTVLIEGESGSGKELVARAIHRTGARRDRRFCPFNCAAMPEDLIDAELFGHAKGAFTGAASERLGLFESADGGSVFLDEVGELSARAQAKVLRALQEGEIRRVGESFARPFDARLIAATNRSLRAEADAGRFRKDLLYRLDVIRISVPPLRERVEDIPLLAARFWREAAGRIGSKAVLGQSVLAALARYDWPGNVRELQNVLTALVVAAPGRGVVGAAQLPAAIAQAAEMPAHESLEGARLKFEQRFVRAALARAAGHRGRTAAALGLSRQGLAKLMQRLHLDA